MDRTTECNLAFKLHDVTAIFDAVGSSPKTQDFSKLSLLFAEEQGYRRFGTGEQNQFVLDGRHNAFSDNPAAEPFGMWSSVMSDQQGSFADNPVLDIAFDERHSSVGITLHFDTFDADYCSSVNVKWYQDGVMVSDKDFAPDKAVFFCENRLDYYTGIKITFMKTSLPYRFLKLQQVDFGLTLSLSESGTNASLLEEVDPVSTEISINTLNFRLFDKDGMFNLINPAGYTEYLQRRQRVELRVRINQDSFFMGMFFWDSVSSYDENSTTFDCVDLIGLLDQTEFWGGIYKNKSAAELFNEIAVSAGGWCAFEVDSSFEGVNVSGHLPICSHRQAVQQIAFAIGAMVDCSRCRAVRVLPIPKAASKVIDYSQSIHGHNIKQKSLITGVVVTAHEYTQNEEEAEIFKSDMESGAHQTVKFFEPVYDLTVTGAAIEESGSNYAIINVETKGEVVITGKKYVDNMQVFKAENNKKRVNESECEVSVEYATLVDTTKAQTVADRLLAYYQNRLEETGSILLENEKVGELTGIMTMYNQQIDGIIESMDVDLTGGLLADIKITGKAV